MKDHGVSREKEFDSDAALDRALHLFWRRGYEGTSIQNLVDELGLNRSSLYATFGDKAQLFDAVMQRYADRTSETLAKTLAPPAAGRAAIATYLMAVVDSVTDDKGERGCLMVNASLSCVSAPPELIERARAAVTGNENAILAALRRDPTLRRRSDLPALARFFSAQSHGLGVLARAGEKRAELRAAARIALEVLPEH